MPGAFQGLLGSSSAVAGIPEYDDGATMDAAVAVGDVVALIGTTTREIIAVLECATTGPVTYRLRGTCRTYQADGDEFTGVFRPAAVGTGSVPTWGTAGSRTTGGAQYAGTGTYEWQGLVTIPAWHCHITAAVYLDAVPGSPAQYNAIWVGFHRDANTSIDAGGLSRNGSSQWCIGVCANTPRNLGAIGTGITNAGAGLTATEDVEWEIGCALYKNAANSTRIGFLQRSSTALAPASGSVATDTDPRTPGFGIFGSFTARVVEWGLNFGRAQ